MKCKSTNILILSFVSILFLITILTFPSSAASVVIVPVEPPLPVGLPDFPDYTRDLDVSMIERVRTAYINLLSGSYNNDVSENYCIILTHAPNSYTYTFTCFNLPELRYANQQLSYFNMGQHYVLYIYDSQTQTWTDNAFSGGWVADFTVRYQDLMSYGNGWVVDMAYDELYSRAGELWWSKDLVLDEIGVTPLPELPDLDNPEIDNPSSPTLPSQPPYDPNISVGENIGNWFSWLGSLLSTLFNNLLSNIKNFFSNLFNNLKSWLQGLKDEIRNGFQNLVNNLTSFFKPFFDNITNLVDKIREKIDYLTEIPTPEQLADILDDLTVYSVITDVIDSVTDFTSSFNDVSEPDSFTIPIHLENLSFLTGLSTYYLDLGVINPVKSLLRVFISALVTYGLIITIIDAIANYINGGGDE